MRRTWAAVALVGILLAGASPAAIFLAWFVTRNTAEDHLTDRGRDALAPVLDTLERHRVAHGRYPPDLDTLVRDGRLAALPMLPHRHELQDVLQPAYAVTRDGSFFTLEFAYLGPDGKWDPGTEWSTYAPDGWGWRSTTFGDNLQFLNTCRLHDEYRGAPSPEGYDRLIRYVAFGGMPAGKIRDIPSNFVPELLGRGEPVAIPEHIRTAGDKAAQRYTVPGFAREYIFIFRYARLPDSRPGREVVWMAFPRLRAVYVHEPGPGGADTWMKLTGER